LSDGLADKQRTGCASMPALGQAARDNELTWDAAGTNVRYLVPVVAKLPFRCRPVQAKERPGGCAPIHVVRDASSNFR
jgi:hypothetical protein